MVIAARLPIHLPLNVCPETFLCVDHNAAVRRIVGKYGGFKCCELLTYGKA